MRPSLLALTFGTLGLAAGFINGCGHHTTTTGSGASPSIPASSSPPLVVPPIQPTPVTPTAAGAVSSCAEKRAAGCLRLALGLVGEGDTEGATEAFVDACVYGAEEACDRALTMTLREEVTSPTARAIRMLTTLCKKANARACAADFHCDGLERCSALCRRDVAGACVTGLRFASGEERSFLARRGCLLGSAPACTEAANDFARAAGAGGDKRPAKDFFRRACQDSVEAACDLLRTTADGICDHDDECDRHHRCGPSGFCVWSR